MTAIRIAVLLILALGLTYASIVRYGEIKTTVFAFGIATALFITLFVRRP